MGARQACKPKWCWSGLFPAPPVVNDTNAEAIPAKFPSLLSREVHRLMRCFPLSTTEYLCLFYSEACISEIGIQLDR